MTLRFRCRHPGGLVLWLVAISQDGTVLWMDSKERAVALTVADRDGANAVLEFLNARAEGGEVEAVECPTVH